MIDYSPIPTMNQVSNKILFGFDHYFLNLMSVIVAIDIIKLFIIAQLEHRSIIIIILNFIVTSLGIRSCELIIKFSFSSTLKRGYSLVKINVRPCEILVESRVCPTHGKGWSSAKADPYQILILHRKEVAHGHSEPRTFHEH